MAERDSETVIRLNEVRKYFRKGKGRSILVKAVDGVNLNVPNGKVIGIAGESGSGKTTLAEILVGLQRPTEGSVLFEEQDIATMDRNQFRVFRRNVQMVFQDPFGSLNPMKSVASVISEPLEVNGVKLTKEKKLETIIQTLESIGLRPGLDFVNRLPRELSGGQRQRVSIARSIILNPKLLVADEPVSMLDVSIRADVLQLMKRLNRDRGLAIVYISHDLASVRYLCDSVAVMNDGKIVEQGPTQTVLDNPTDSYTQSLISAVPKIEEFSDEG